MNDILPWLLGLELLLLVMLAPRRRGPNGPGAFNTVNLAALALSAAGAMLVFVSRDVIMFFIALELVSACGWLLLGRDGSCTDRAMNNKITTRHVLLSLTGSALLIMGLSIIYGSPGIVRGMADNVPSDLAQLAGVLVFAGLGIRVGAVPFGLHLPDTARAMTNMGAASLLILPFIAGMIALLRLAAMISPGLGGRFWPVAALLAVVSTGLAGVAALRERNVRRLLAYILVGQGGFMLVGLAAGFSLQTASDGHLSAGHAFGGTLFYLFAITPAIVGAFGVLVYLGRRDGEINDVDELAGLGRSRPWAAAAMALFLLSLSGIPPLAGFWGRVAILLPTLIAVDAMAECASRWFIALAFAAAANAVLTTVVCSRLLAIMCFRMPLATPIVRGSRMTLAAVAGCAVLTILIGAGGGPLLEESFIRRTVEDCVSSYDVVTVKSQFKAARDEASRDPRGNKKTLP